MPWAIHILNLVLFSFARFVVLKFASLWHAIALAIAALFACTSLILKIALPGERFWLIAAGLSLGLLSYSLLPATGAKFGWRVWGTLYGAFAGILGVVAYFVGFSWWFSVSAISMGLLFYTLIDSLIAKYPQTESKRGAAGWITLFSVTMLVALGVLQFFGVRPDQETAGQLSGIEKIFEGLQMTLGTLVAFPATFAATALVASLAELIRNQSEKLDDEEREERRRLLGRVPVHHNLRTVKCRLVLRGSAEHERVTQACESGLVEIWLTGTGAGTIRFEVGEFITLIETYMPNFASGDGHYDLIISHGAQRRIIAYDTVAHFCGLLTDPGQAALVRAFTNQTVSIIQQNLTSAMISSTEKRIVALRQMASGHLDRILVIGNRSQYLGFCEREKLVEEVFTT